MSAGKYIIAIMVGNLLAVCVTLLFVYSLCFYMFLCSQVNKNKKICASDEFILTPTQKNINLLTTCFTEKGGGGTGREGKGGGGRGR